LKQTPHLPSRCGYIAIIGAPNAGKSTLINQLVGSKIAIVTPKVQTTRKKILGIVNHGESQLLFVDTPGIFQAKRAFEKNMVSAAMEGAKEADIVLLLVDATHPVSEETKFILESLSTFRGEKILALNKVDAAKKIHLPPLAQQLFETGLFAHCFMISALTGDGVEPMLRHAAAAVPEGPWLYPGDQASDVSMRDLAAEITREKAFLALRQELPYSLKVETESWEEKEKALTIRQVICVETEGQKKITIGKGGAMLKRIGEQSRRELTKILERKVNLFLFVKVVEGWKEKS